MSETNGSIRCFTSKDAPKDALRGERVVVLGYGKAGTHVCHELARYCRSARDRQYRRFVCQAGTRAEGFTVKPIAEAVADGDVILVLLPDEVIPEVFATDIGPHLVPKSAILFGSGYPLGYNQISVPQGIDVLMLCTADGWRTQPASDSWKNAGSMP